MLSQMKIKSRRPEDGGPVPKQRTAAARLGTELSDGKACGTLEKGG